MNSNQKPTGRAKSIPVSIFIGTIVFLSTAFVISSIAALLIDCQIIKESNAGYCVMIALSISSFFGTSLTIQQCKRRKTLAAFLSAAIYLGCMMSINALFWKGEYEGIMPTAVIILCGCGLSLFLKTNHKNRKRKGKKQYHNR